MKIRQAKKLLTKWGRWELPFEMRAKVVKAARYRYRHRARRKRKRARSRKSCLARNYPAKVWVDGKFLGYAYSISVTLP